VPLGQSLEWDARIVEEYPDEFLHWMSLPRGYEMFKKKRMDVCGSCLRLHKIAALNRNHFGKNLIPSQAGPRVRLPATDKGPADPRAVITML
jgi:hypothetical protein